MKPQKNSRLLLDLASLSFVLVVAVGGFFLRELGIALALLMITAVVLTLTRREPRLFCSKVCPRGRALGFALAPLSRRKPLPRFLTLLPFRRFLCGFMMFCVFSNLFRPAPGLLLPAWIGTVFWVLCALSLSAGILMGILWKPRAWCAVCPLGTLQDTIRQAR